MKTRGKMKTLIRKLIQSRRYMKLEAKKKAPQMKGSASKLDKKKRIHVLEEQMLEYREMFRKKLEDATEKQKKRYRKWEIEVEMLWKELEVKG